MTKWILNLRKSSMAVLLGASLIFASCGKNPEQDIVKDVDVYTELRDGDVWVNLKANFKLGEASLTEISFPIVNPDDSSIRYGEISFTPLEEVGYNEISLSFNLSASDEVQGGLASLPNGSELPVAGMNNGDVLQLVIDSINSRIYLGASDSMTVLGFAVSIAEFEKLGDLINGANVFVGFNIKEVLGSVGIYTGDQPLKNGLAFFVDIHSVIPQEVLELARSGRHIDEFEFQAALSKAEFRATSRSKKAPFRNIGNTPHNFMSIYKEVEELGNKTLHFIPTEE